jgi:hypothetical protein
VFFLETFDPVQMRYAGLEWKKLVEFVEFIARSVESVRPLAPEDANCKLTCLAARSRHLAYALSHDPA